MSGIATLIDDYETATKAAERGLQANPGDLRLHNNLAFAQLRIGDVLSAQHTFEPLMAVLHDPERIAEMATYGLLQMSLGLHAEGVAAYETAIRRATEVSDSKTVVRAALNLAISEFDVLHSVDPDLIRQTIAHLRDAADPQSLGTAMSLARRLMREERMESEGVAAVGKEFVEAVREGAGKLLGSLFAESVDKATSEGRGNREHRRLGY
jgi:tetratricopeptide (TPR) repeat protein